MTNTLNNTVLDLEGLTHRLWDTERGEEFVVHVEPRLSIPKGSLVAILGPSGCGKTSLLTLLGLLRRPSNAASIRRFTITVPDGESEREYDLRDLWCRNQQSTIEYLRRRHIGFALQSGELLPSLTVWENIAAPLELNGFSRKEIRTRVEELICTFGLDRTRDLTADSESASPSIPAANQHSPHGALPQTGPRLARSRINKLSGGEYQRVALARAIVHRPSLIFVDEPTANLNRELARGALMQLQALLKRVGSSSAVLMITHDEALAIEFADLIVRMEPVPTRPAGRVVRIETNHSQADREPS